MAIGTNKTKLSKTFWLLTNSKDTPICGFAAKTDSPSLDMSAKLGSPLNSVAKSSVIWDTSRPVVTRVVSNTLPLSSAVVSSDTLQPLVQLIDAGITNLVEDDSRNVVCVFLVCKLAAAAVVVEPLRSWSWSNDYKNYYLLLLKKEKKGIDSERQEWVKFVRPIRSKIAKLNVFSQSEANNGCRSSSHLMTSQGAFVLAASTSFRW